MDFIFNYQTLIIVSMILIAAGIIIYLVIRNKENDSNTNDSYVLALRYLIENDFSQAIEKFKDAVRENSDNIDAYLKLGDILREQGLFKNAIKIHYDLSLRATLTTIEKNNVLFSLALDYYKNGNPDKAEPLLKTLFQKNEYKLKAAPFLVEIYQKEGMFLKAISIIESTDLKVTDKFKNRLIALKLLEAQLQTSKNEIKVARNLYKEIIKQKDSNLEAYMFLGESYINENQSDKAKKLWVDYCVKHPQQSSILFSRLEKLLFEQGKYDELQSLFAKIIKDAPGNIYGYCALAEILKKKNEFESADKVILDGLEQSPDAQVLRQEQVRLMVERENFKAAAEKFMELMPTSNCLQEYCFSCKNCSNRSEEPIIICSECGKINEF